MEELPVRNRVRLARLEAGFSQEDLAVRCGVTRQTIGLIEANKYNPTLRLCLLIARATGKRLDELFWMEESHE